MKFLTPLLLITCIASAACNTSSNDLQRLAPQQEKAAYRPLSEECRHELTQTAARSTTLLFCCQNPEYSESLEQLFYLGGPWDKPGNYAKKCGISMARCGCNLATTRVCLQCISATAGLAGFGMLFGALCNSTDAGTIAGIGCEILFGSSALTTCLHCAGAKRIDDNPSCTERCDGNILDRLSNPDNWSQEGIEEKASLLSKPTETREPREEI